MNLINNVMNKHHCPTQDKGMSPKRKEDNKKAWTLHFVCLFRYRLLQVGSRQSPQTVIFRPQ